MCYINYTPDIDQWDMMDYPPSPGPRPRPRVGWVVPVDAASLGASLDAYAEQIPRITMLRLCHRLGGGSLSTLPQEILDHIVTQIYQSEKAVSQVKWNRQFDCFQARCTTSQHLNFDDGEIEEVWCDLFLEHDWCCKELSSDDSASEEPTIQQKREIVEEFYDDDPDARGEALNDHYDTRDTWLN